MALGMEVGLGPGHIVLDGDSSPPQKGAEPPPIFGPFYRTWYMLLPVRLSSVVCLSSVCL